MGIEEHKKERIKKRKGEEEENKEKGKRNCGFKIAEEQNQTETFKESRNKAGIAMH